VALRHSESETGDVVTDPYSISLYDRRRRMSYNLFVLCMYTPPRHKHAARYLSAGAGAGPGAGAGAGRVGGAVSYAATRCGWGCGRRTEAWE
jgi:hypothetical protein